MGNLLFYYNGFGEKAYRSTNGRSITHCLNEPPHRPKTARLHQPALWQLSDEQLAEITIHIQQLCIATNYFVEKELLFIVH